MKHSEYVERCSKLADVIQDLKAEPEFRRHYMAQRNHERTSTAAGSNIGVRRRDLLKQFGQRIRPGLTMLDLVTLEAHFNNRYGLDPYGIEQPVQPVQTESTALQTAWADLTIGTIFGAVGAVGTIPAVQPEPQPESTTMTLTIETTATTTVNGIDASKLSNETIYGLISKAEARIASFSTMRKKPLALKNELADLDRGIDVLIALVDDREALIPAELKTKKAK